jgi:hypothetical protein
MRHQAEDISLAITNAGNVFDGTIRIRLRTGRASRIAITHHDLSVGVELMQCVVVGEITAFAVGNRHSQHRSLRTTVGKGGVRHFDPQPHHVANKP